MQQAKAIAFTSIESKELLTKRERFAKKNPIIPVQVPSVNTANNYLAEIALLHIMDSSPTSAAENLPTHDQSNTTDLSPASAVAVNIVQPMVVPRVPEQLSSSFSSRHYVKLNVGGSIFQTTMSTLCNCKCDCMLRAMFSGRMEVLCDEEGYVLIDRCGKHFSSVLNFLRQGSCPLPECKVEVEELMQEARYYLIQVLITDMPTARAV